MRWQKSADTDYKFDPDYHISCGLILINISLNHYYQYLALLQRYGKAMNIVVIVYLLRMEHSLVLLSESR